MDVSAKLVLTHDGAYPTERTLVGAKISVKTDMSNLNSAVDPDYSDLYYIFIDVGKRVTPYQRSLEYLMANRVKENIPPGVDLKIIRFAKKMSQFPNGVPFSKFANEKIRMETSRIFPGLKKLDEELKFERVRTTVIILTNGKISDTRKVKRVLNKGEIALPDSCKVHVLGFGKRKNSRFLKYLADGLRGKYMAVEDTSDIYRSLRDLGVSETPVANSSNDKVLIVADTHMGARGRNISNSIIKSIWTRLPEETPVKLISMGQKPTIFFNSTRGFNMPPSISKKNHSKNDLPKTLLNEFRKSPNIDSVFIVSDGSMSGLERTIKAIANQKIGLPSDPNYIVLKAGKRNKSHTGMIDLANALGGMFYKIKNIEDINSFMVVKPVNFKGGVTIRFSDRFRIARMNGVYFPLYGDKSLRLKENAGAGGDDYLISLIDVPPDEGTYHGEVEITYSRSPTSTLSKKIDITLPRSYAVKMDETLMGEIDYNDLVTRFTKEKSSRSNINAVTGKEISDLVDRYMEEEGLQLFEHKIASVITEKLVFQSSLIIAIQRRDVQKAIMSIIKENYFGSRAIIFSSNENYRSVTIQGRSRDIFAFTISQELLDGIRPDDLRDIKRAANMLVTEVVSFMANVSTGTSNLAVIYDFYDLARKLVKPDSSNTMLKSFINALVEAFEPWNMKMLFLTSSNDSTIDELSQDLPTVNMATDGVDEKLSNPINVVKRILSRAHVDYSAGPDWIRVRGTTLATGQADVMPTDTYMIMGDEIRRVVNKVRINFPLTDGIREFLFTVMSPDDPIIWSQQLATQMRVGFTSARDTIIVNDIRITKGESAEPGKDPNSVYVDTEWRAMSTVGSSLEIEDARVLISEIMRNASSRTEINSSAGI